MDSDLQCFNGASTKPWGYVELIVTFGRPTMDELIMVPSTIHLKIKYYTVEGLAATLHGDVQVERRCFEA